MKRYLEDGETVYAGNCILKWDATRHELVFHECEAELTTDIGGEVVIYEGGFPVAVSYDDEFEEEVSNMEGKLTMQRYYLIEGDRIYCTGCWLLVGSNNGLRFDGDEDSMFHEGEEVLFDEELGKYYILLRVPNKEKNK